MAEDNNNYGSLSGDEPVQNSEQPSVEELQKELSNVKKQNAGLLAQQRQNKQPASSANQPAPKPALDTAQPTSSNATNDSSANLQASFAELKKLNDSLIAEKNAANQRSSFVNKAKEDGIELSGDDINVIANSNDQDATYKYIKSLKSNLGSRKYAPRANVFTRTKDNVGAELAKQDNSVQGLGGLIAKQKQ